MKIRAISSNKIFTAVLLAFLFHSQITFSQTTTNQITVTRILFVLDASSSMIETWSNTSKITAARKIISDLADSLSAEPDVQLALRVYGHQFPSPENNCEDTKLEVPFASHNAITVKNFLNGIKPKGITPIAYSLEKSADDFPHDVRSRNIIILVTDGVESCTGDPCSISLKLQQQRIFLRPFVIGLNMNPASFESMDCIGTYFNAQSPDALKSIMKTVVDRVLSSGSVQVNLLDKDGKPLETDVNMTFTDHATGIVKYNFYHTITDRGVADTMQLDPVSEYDLLIHTLPSITREHLVFNSNKTEVINVPASQGFLKIVLEGKTINNNLNSKIKVLVRQAGSDETLIVQNLTESIKFLSGKYDLEVLTLPRIQIKNVEVNQSTTTTVQVPLPGVLSISKTYPGIGSIMLQDGDALVKIYQLNENLNNETIGLQAGNYSIVFRSKFSKKSTETITKKFQIKTGEITSIKL